MQMELKILLFILYFPKVLIAEKGQIINLTIEFMIGCALFLGREGEN